MSDHVPVPLAPIFRLAAEVLWDGETNDSSQWQEFSCVAVIRAQYLLKTTETTSSAVKNFLEDLGVVTTSARQFPDELSFVEKQSWRYAWLSFVADLAEEWGVEG